MDLKLSKIHEDKRGAIFLVENLLEDNKELTFMEIKMGFARGGCLHSNDEFFAVIRGRVRYLYGEKERCMVQGESGKIPANVPHAFIALEDSIVSEWGIITAEKKADIKDEKMREKVEGINKSIGRVYL